jgi:hypothetical protein
LILLSSTTLSCIVILARSSLSHASAYTQPTTKQMSIDNAQKHHDLASRNDTENTPPDDPSRRISRSQSRKISFPSNFLKKMTVIGKTWTANLFIFVIIAIFTVGLDIYEQNEDFIL